MPAFLFRYACFPVTIQGGGVVFKGAAGGSGVVIVKEPTVASSVWTLKQAYLNKKAGTWSS